MRGARCDGKIPHRFVRVRDARTPDPESEAISSEREWEQTETDTVFDYVTL